MQIDGQVAIVTGGARGLGGATAAHLAALGAKVAVLDYDAEGAQAAADKIGGAGFGVDVRDAAAVEAVVDQVADTLGAARVVVNCAGIADAARIVGRDGATSVDLFRRVIEVNLIGSYTVASFAVKHMMDLEPLDGERGVVINTSSVAYEDGQMGQSAYAASKGGIAGMTLPLARELARPGIRVMAIAPGLFRTPMMESLPDEVTEKITANIPFPARLGDPNEFARLAADIVGNSYLNGSVIRLDGAVRLPPK
ncbi:MAG: SDR family NAD(P)-dependent oxidoreductase [Pseudomonadota bacterium]